MKSIFLWLLNKYSKTELGRIEIHRILHEQVKNQYSERTSLGNIYNSFTESVLANDVILTFVREKEGDALKTLKGGITYTLNKVLNSIENSSILMGTQTEEPKVLNLWEHSGWGDSVYFSSFEERRIAGHLQERLKLGDEIRSKMDSGKVGRFEIIDIEYCRDPRDQFFATVKDLGYL